MKVTNYAEWKQAVSSEHKKLFNVSYYLNENGKERMNAYDTLLGMSELCRTPEELVEWIDSKEGLGKHDAAYLESGHVSPAIAALRRIIKAQ